MADFAELGIKVTSTGAGKAQTDLKGVQSQAEKTEKSVLSLQKMISNLKSLLAIGVGGATISTLIQMADKMKSLSAQVKFVTKSVDEYNAVQKRLFDISQNTRSSLEATTTLYTKSARALQDYGYSQKQLLGFTETINKAMIVGGVGAQEQASALFQLSQALGSGRLQGDEFRTIAESAPIILDVVAEYMGKSRAEVKKLAGDGKLTSQVLFEAISGSAEKISQKFQTMPITFGESMTLMRNSMLKFIADLDTSTGITGALANLVAFLALNFSTLATAVGYATAAYIAYNAVSLVSNLKAALGGVTLLQAGFVGLAMAIRTATAAMIANPFGMLAIAIVGLIYVFDEFISDLETGFGTFNATWGDVAQGVWLDFKDIAVEVWDDVTNYIDTAVSQITESFGSTISSLGELFVALLSIAKSVINGLIGRFVLAYQTVVMAWNDFPSAMETLSISAINGLVSIIEKGINFILDKIKLLLGYLNKAASAVGFKNLFDLSYMSVELPKIEGSKEAKNFKDQYAKLFNDISQTDYLGDAFSSIENYISLAGARGKIHNKSAQLKNNKDADLSQQGLGVMPTTNTSDSANDKNKSGSRKGERKPRSNR